MGYMRTAMLLAALTALFLGAGYLLGGQGGMVIGLLVALGMNAFAYWNSDKVVLRMHNARQVDRRTAPEFYGLVAQLADRAGLPMPKVYVIDTDQPNAFATGRSPEHAAVAATTGLLRRLSSEEVAGVIAHELAHIKHRDTLIMTVTATMAGAIAMLGNMLMFSNLFGGRDDNRGGGLAAILAMVLAPVAAGMVQMAISRSREYEADRIGAEICGRPMALAGALAKISRAAGQVVNMPAEQNPASASLFIVNPLHALRMDRLFATHPPTEDRIARLQAMAAGGTSRTAGPWGTR